MPPNRRKDTGGSVLAAIVIENILFFMPPRKSSISDRRNKSEREISDGHAGDFAAGGSQAEAFLDRVIGDSAVSLTRRSLVHLGTIFSALSGIRFYRDFTRRRVLVFRWFEDHLAELEPFVLILHVHLAACASRGPRPLSPDHDSPTDSS
jgi:hypothetical protein